MCSSDLAISSHLGLSDLEMERVCLPAARTHQRIALRLQPPHPTWLTEVVLHLRKLISRRVAKSSIQFHRNNCTQKCVGGAGSLVLSRSFVPLILRANDGKRQELFFI